MSEQDARAFDHDKLELLERQLADRITERIRPSLFRLYATVGGAVIAVLGFVGWDVVTDIKKDAVSQITRDLDQEVEPKVKEIDRIFIETRVLAEQANEVITAVKKQLELFEPKAAQLKQTFEDINKLNSDISSLDVDLKNFATIYKQELAPALEKLDTLSDQLQVLAQQVKQLNTIALTEEPAGGDATMSSQSSRTEIIESVIAKTSAAEQKYVEERERSTVFIQFASAPREQARELSEALKRKGYIVPGEDREDGAKNKREVRFFHESDGDKAAQLAKDTTAFLREQGFSERDVPDVEASSLVNFRGKKPREGVLELWLDMRLLE